MNKTNRNQKGKVNGSKASRIFGAFPFFLSSLLKKLKHKEAESADDSNGAESRSSRRASPFKIYTAEEVQSSSSLSVINGFVVDLSSWIKQHPGGSATIQVLIGGDASDVFNAQHRGSSEVAEKLQTLVVGALSYSNPSAIVSRQAR